MQKIVSAAARCNPSAIDAYIDSVEVFFRRERYRQAVENGEWFERIGKIDPCKLPNGFVIGYRLVVNNSRDPLTLQHVERVTNRYGGVISRFDIAIDIQMPTADAAKWLKNWIAQHALLRWRRRGPMLDVGGTAYYDGSTIYWVQWKQRRYPRNLVVYADKHNRTTGELHCVHLELRFLKADAIRRQGIASVSDLTRINPNVLLHKHVKFTDAAERRMLRITRATIKAEREQHRIAGKREQHRKRYRTDAYVDQYRSRLVERVKGMLHRNGSDRAQNVKHLSKQSMKAVTPPFDIPHKLIWTGTLKGGALKTQRYFKKGVW